MTKKKTKNRNVNSVKDSSSKDALFLYIKEISKIPLLSKEEEVKFAKLASGGDVVAKNKLINANLRFVISIAKKYQGQGLPFEDLISEGNLGLLSAVGHFDVNKGYRFITYAVWWIRQSMLKAIHEKGRMIRLPYNKVNDLSKMQKARQVLQKDSFTNRGEDIQQIASYLDIPCEKAENLMQISQDACFMEDQSSKFNNSVIKDMIVDEYSNSPVENAINSSLRDELEAAVNNLESRSAVVIRNRFGLGDTGPLTLEEIGEIHNLSKERVRQIERRALGQLQQSSRRKVLKSYIV